MVNFKLGNDLLNSGQALYPLSYKNPWQGHFIKFMTSTVLILAGCKTPVT